ncbi:MAG: glutamine-hydrolyzing carbamoyl-phosphate synthase small subunit [Akkermansia sp.]|nr:glutamine-hydrolyzing carbamoyl-phosphate synthase small subunit [Akkermansia sp.]
MKAILALENGTIFEGTSFGATGTFTGELTFNTSVVGYQELITDPSWKGLFLTYTYTHIGSYGVNEDDNESSRPQAAAVIATELSRLHSNWRATESFGDWLARYGVPGIEGVDTRKLTLIIREQGSMRACITTELSADEAIATAKAAPTLTGADTAVKVSTAAPYRWDGESRAWKLPNKSRGDLSYYTELPAATHKAAVLDLGVQRSVLATLRRDGFDVTVLPATSSAEDILAMGVDGLFISHGPGDPAALSGIAAEVAKLVGKLPIYAMGLGHLVLSIALGCKTVKLPFGHHGGNYAVRDLRSNAVSITTQNNFFAVETDSVCGDALITHTNLSDGTVAGVASKSFPAAGVQFLPVPPPDDASRTFAEFIDMVDSFKK